MSVLDSRGEKAPGIAAISQTMRFTHGLARWLRWEHRCRHGAINDPLLLSPLLKEYCHYRRVHNGVSERTLVRDVETARGFLGQLSRRRKSIPRTALPDVDP